MNILNATWLETFTILCETGHFTRAATRLGMTQPGVSQHLRKLEAQVGKALVLQVGKGFSVTPAGEAVLAVGKARRAQERDLRDQIEADNPDAGEVRVGCSGSFATWIYPYFLKRMQKAPDLVITLSAAPQDSVMQRVLDGDLDLGVIADKVDHPRLDASPLAREELCLVLPACHATGDLTLDALNDLGFVAHPDGYAYADDLFSLNFPETFKGADRLRVRTFVNQIGQIPLPVSQGLGYTILPRSGVEAFPRQQDLAIIPLPRRRYHDLWLISRQGRSTFARIASIKALMERAATSLS